MKHIYLLSILLFFSICEASAYQTETVNDGHLVIVNGEDMVGAFTLRNQNISPDKAEYNWVLYQKSKNGALVKIDSGSRVTGDEKIWALPLTRQKPIEFGPFKFYWSGKSNGRGFIYFNYYSSNSKIRYCILIHAAISEATQSMEQCEFKLVQYNA